ncbi:hypothetical protein HN954_02610 [bacterium]|jgi:hypothetical protein|nr:hypothetical protein [bacterium]MBT6831650.1 hypothetical protein [bacterium]MBT6996296.1 hypothetical protein [bacterium]MBT7772974.1 hypothetical protein [bacterium]
MENEIDYSNEDAENFAHHQETADPLVAGIVFGNLSPETEKYAAPFVEDVLAATEGAVFYGKNSWETSNEAVHFGI